MNFGLPYPSLSGKLGALLFGLLSALASNAQAQTAEKIVDSHIKALGGAKALGAVKALRLTGTVSGGDEFIWRSQAPDSFYFEMRHGDMHEVDAIKGAKAWREDQIGGVRTLVGMEQARARALSAHRNNHFLGYKKDKTRLHLRGREVVDGRPTHAIEVISSAGAQRTVFFDVVTGLIVKEEQERDGSTEEIFFSDYRPVDGVREPHRLRIKRGGQSLDLVVLGAAHNERVDPALFDFPKRAAAPLPDFATLFKSVVENQKELEKAKGDYTYTKTQTEIETDEKGRPKESKEETYEVFFVKGRDIERLVARNGQPLRGDEVRKEQERIDKVIREGEERGRKAAEKQARSGKKEPEGKSVSLSLFQVLRVVQFVNPRRERFRGKEAVVYDFEPRPDARPVDRAEAWIQKLSGTMWMDEVDKGVLRAEARMTESIKMGGGAVLSVHSGSSFVFEQEFIRGEVWLPSYTEVHASGRVLMVKGFRVNQKERFSDYKKFNVETSSDIKPPRS